MFDESLIFYHLRMPLAINIKQKSYFTGFTSMDQQGFKELVVKHEAVLKASAFYMTRNTVLAKDLLQDTLLKALSNSDKFVTGSNMEAWLHVIMRNTLYNMTRRAAVKRKTVDEADAMTSEPPSLEPSVNGGDSVIIQRDLQNAIDSLPEIFRIAFSMFVKGYKYHEIADATAVPIGTVKTRIFIARKMLKEQLDEYDPQFLLRLAS